jgi:prepilin-type N-terminal cleavage/methylation domain-containing protein
MIGKSKGFTLIEIVLATVILLSLIAALVINFDSLDSARYAEAKENLKTYLINKRTQAAYQQKDLELSFNEDYTINSAEDPELLAAITNDLRILESSTTKIIFFLDGTVEESYIITSSNDGKITNTFRINVIGKIDYDK